MKPQRETLADQRDHQSNRDMEERDQARAKADEAIVNAEHFKASIKKPTGNELSDDKFFHLTCHIDGQTISKIEHGEFVDLERLLPPDRFNKNPVDEGHLEFRHVDGATYLAPAAASHEKRITHIRKWEQAFRVYASIYCRVNPMRTSEIWQYIDVINSAAAAYVWDNVARYDYTFRQLMAFNPSRSWSTIYNHMWNLTMTEPIQRAQHKGEHVKNRSKSEGTARDITDYCWSFNRGFCKFGTRCDFINRCNYCDSTSHGANTCYKLAAKKQQNEGGENNRSRKHHKKDKKDRNGKSDDK